MIYVISYFNSPKVPIVCDIIGVFFLITFNSEPLRERQRIKYEIKQQGIGYFCIVLSEDSYTHLIHVTVLYIIVHII